MLIHHSSNHWVNQFAICITSGVILSVLVAWGSAYTEDTGTRSRFGPVEDPASFPIEDTRSTIRQDPPNYYSPPRRNDGWYFWTLHDGSDVKIWSHAFDVLALHTPELNWIETMPFDQRPAWSIIQHPPTSAQLYADVDLLEEARGWPIPCAISIIETNRFRVSWRIISGIQFGSHTIYPACPRVFPTKPILLGFFVDTMFYGVVVWCFIRILRSIISVIRSKRGLCRGCGYPLHTLDQCPECGSPITVKKKTVSQQ